MLPFPRFQEKHAWSRMPWWSPCHPSMLQLDTGNPGCEKVATRATAMSIGSSELGKQVGGLQDDRVPQKLRTFNQGPIRLRRDAMTLDRSPRSDHAGGESPAHGHARGSVYLPTSALRSAMHPADAAP